MTKIYVDDVIRILRFEPSGMTTAELAARLGRDAVNVSGKLSRMAAYGQLDRDWERSHRNLRKCRWRLKESTHGSNVRPIKDGGRTTRNMVNVLSEVMRIKGGSNV